MSTVVTNSTVNDAAILERVMSEGCGQRHLRHNVARYINSLEFSAEEKARMHDLAFRNLRGALTGSERKEFYAFAKAGSVLSILNVKARNVLGIKPK